MLMNKLQIFLYFVSKMSKGGLVKFYQSLNPLFPPTIDVLVDLLETTVGYTVTYHILGFTSLANSTTEQTVTYVRKFPIEQNEYFIAESFLINSADSKTCVLKNSDAGNLYFNIPAPSSSSRRAIDPTTVSLRLYKFSSGVVYVHSNLPNEEAELAEL